MKSMAKKILEDINSIDKDSLTVSDFCNKVKETYNKYFPKSLCHARFSKAIHPSIFIDCYMANGPDEFESGIPQNDILHLAFSIYLESKMDKDSPMPDSFALEAVNHGIRIRPENKYLAYGFHTFPFRKVKGNAKKILSTLDKYFKKAKEDIIDLIERDEFYQKDSSFVKSKVM